MRSTFTTPRSVKGTDTDEYDRVMGVASVGCRETVRFGEENVSGLEENPEGVAHNSVDLDETLEGDDLCHVNDSGADENSKGIRSASLAECLDRMRAQTNTSIPATCASRGGNVGSSPYANLGQKRLINSKSFTILPNF